MDDIAWPGDRMSPPLGRPKKWRLRVVTLKEEPYVMYSALDQQTHSCPAQALRCRLAAQPNKNKQCVYASSAQSVKQSVNLYERQMRVE